MRRRSPLLFAMALAVLGSGCHLIQSKEETASVPSVSQAANAQALSVAPIERDVWDRFSALVMVVDEDPPAVPARIDIMGVVQEDGSVTLISNKVFSTIGKTTEEFLREIHDYYVPRFFKTVRFLHTDAPTYGVRGEVRSPGLEVLMRPTTVLQAIQLAGGFTESANKKKVQVTRLHMGSSVWEQYTTTHIVNCVKAGSDPRADMQVLRNDHIVVPRSFWKHVFPPSEERLTNGLSQ